LLRPRARLAAFVSVAVVLVVVGTAPTEAMTPVGTSAQVPSTAQAVTASSKHSGGQYAIGRPPGSAYSRYMKTADSGVLHGMGCGDGKAVLQHRQPLNSLVVLDFGRPAFARGLQGTEMFGTGFHPLGWILHGVEAFARGFRDCVGRERATLRIALGTNNIGGDVGYTHGRAWGRMVERANAWTSNSHVAPSVTFVGANDIEPGWGGPKHTRSWVRGYSAVTSWPYYDYGGLAGCPPAGTCQGRWMLEDLWWVAWGAPTAYPLPEIYTRNGISADQWYHLSVYSVERHNSVMGFVGVMSQHSACKQVRDPCRGLDNRPEQAWKQLSSRVTADRRTAVHIGCATDIRWQRTPKGR
jgi:hypothetical protein